MAFITGELALIAFVFATGIAVPHIVYGIVFFLLGAGCVTASFVILLILLTTIIWSSPVHPDTLENQDYNSFPTHVAFLEHICKCYSNSLRENYETYRERATMFDNSLMLLFIGVIILLIIKFGQGVVVWHNIIR